MSDTESIDSETIRDDIPRPCSITVADMRKTVTKVRKRNKVTGPAKRGEIMAVIEAHIDNLNGPTMGINSGDENCGTSIRS